MQTPPRPSRAIGDDIVVSALEFSVQAHGCVVPRPRRVFYRLVGHRCGKPHLRWLRSEPGRSLLDVLLNP